MSTTDALLLLSAAEGRLCDALSVALDKVGTTNLEVALARVRLAAHGAKCRIAAAEKTLSIIAGVVLNDLLAFARRVEAAFDEGAEALGQSAEAQALDPSAEAKAARRAARIARRAARRAASVIDVPLAPEPSPDAPAPSGPYDHDARNGTATAATARERDL